MAQNTKQHPSLGKVPRGKGGSRPLDGPGVGKSAGSVDNTRLGMTGATSHAGGKAHPSLGSVPRTKNPAPISYNTVGGKPARAKGW